VFDLETVGSCLGASIPPAWEGLESWLVPSLIFGAAVGLSLGLTGGGGSILAVPSLVYGLGLPPRDATGVSLAAVGATALIGFFQKWRAGEVDLKAGVWFSVGGILGAPGGSWLGRVLPEALLMPLFTGLMLFVALRMWRKAGKAASRQKEPGLISAPPVNAANASIRSVQTAPNTAIGPLASTPRAAASWVWLPTVGLGAGALSGLFGVGGGFIIVPALVMMTGMNMSRAIGTSLMVIALIGASGVLAFLESLPRGAMPWELTAGFVTGGVLGMSLGTRLVRRLRETALQRGFAVLILVVATFVIVQSLGD